MHFNKLKTIFVSAAMFSTAVHAEWTSLEYQGFYQRLQQFNKNDYQLVELTFSVPKTQGCHLMDANISKGTTQYPLVFNEQQRLYFPFDRSLKSGRALVNLNVDGNANNCAIAMQISAKQPRKDYQRQELIQMVEEINQLSSSLQGFPVRYFMADIDGLQFEFDEKIVYLSSNHIQKKSTEGKISLTLAEINVLDSVSFSSLPRVVSALKLAS